MYLTTAEDMRISLLRRVSVSHYPGGYVYRGGYAYRRGYAYLTAEEGMRISLPQIMLRRNPRTCAETRNSKTLNPNPETLNPES